MITRDSQGRPLPQYAPSPLPSPRPAKPVAVLSLHPLAMWPHVFKLTGIVGLLSAGVAIIYTLEHPNVTMQTLLWLFVLTVAFLAMLRFAYQYYRWKHTKIYVSATGVRIFSLSLWERTDKTIPDQQCELMVKQTLLDSALNTGTLAIKHHDEVILLHWLMPFDRVRDFLDWNITR